MFHLVQRVPCYSELWSSVLKGLQQVSKYFCRISNSERQGEDNAFSDPQKDNVVVEWSEGFQTANLALIPDSLFVGPFLDV